jgi:group I intron endonuclease
MFYYLYEIKNNINGKIYVGVHKTKRIDDGYMGSGKVIQSAIKKYGRDNFTKTIIETFNTLESMYAREREVVTEEFVSSSKTYNLAVGGSGGSILQNRKSWPKGKKHSEETIQKLKISSTGRRHSDQTLEKMKKNNWAVKNPKEQREHAKVAGKKRWDCLKTEDHKKEAKNKISQSLKQTNKQRIGPHPNVGIKRSKVKCPHCNKEGATNTMSRFHFDKCNILINGG